MTALWREGGCLGTQAGWAGPGSDNWGACGRKGKWSRIWGNFLALKYLKNCYIVFSIKKEC